MQCPFHEILVAMVSESVLPTIREKHGYLHDFGLKMLEVRCPFLVWLYTQNLLVKLKKIGFTDTSLSWFKRYQLELRLYGSIILFRTL